MGRKSKLAEIPSQQPAPFLTQRLMTFLQTHEAFDMKHAFDSSKGVEIWAAFQCYKGVILYNSNKYTIPLFPIIPVENQAGRPFAAIACVTFATQPANCCRRPLGNIDPSSSAVTLATNSRRQRRGLGALRLGSSRDGAKNMLEV